MVLTNWPSQAFTSIRSLGSNLVNAFFLRLYQFLDEFQLFLAEVPEIGICKEQSLLFLLVFVFTRWIQPDSLEDKEFNARSFGIDLF